MVTNYRGKIHLSGWDCYSSKGGREPIKVPREEFVHLSPIQQCGICARHAGLPIAHVYRIPVFLDESSPSQDRTAGGMGT